MFTCQFYHPSPRSRPFARSRTGWLSPLIARSSGAPVGGDAWPLASFPVKQAGAPTQAHRTPSRRTRGCGTGSGCQGWRRGAGPVRSTGRSGAAADDLEQRGRSAPCRVARGRKDGQGLTLGPSSVTPAVVPLPGRGRLPAVVSRETAPDRTAPSRTRTRVRRASQRDPRRVGMSRISPIPMIAAPPRGVGYSMPSSAVTPSSRPSPLRPTVGSSAGGSHASCISPLPR
jgi:hypothetical protein